MRNENPLNIMMFSNQNVFDRKIEMDSYKGITRKFPGNAFLL